MYYFEATVGISIVWKWKLAESDAQTWENKRYLEAGRLLEIVGVRVEMDAGVGHC